MNTFENIYMEMFNDIYKSPEGWPDNLSPLDLAKRAAKKYAKQYLQQVATKLEPYDNGYDLLSQIPYRLMDEIDAQ